MAKISTYDFDRTVRDDDAWIGTDSVNKSTKQYTAKDVANYLNIKGKISISGQMVFRYWTNNTPVATVPGSGDFYGPANDSAFTSITTIQLSVKDSSGQNVVGFMSYLVSNNILINEQDKISTFGHFKIDSYTVNNPDDGFYTLNLTNIAGNGNLKELLSYNFALFTLPASQRPTSPTFEFVQSTPSPTWTINHNLAKFPSITVIDSAKTVVVGEYTYVDNNNVILTFSAGFSGKAFLN